MRELFFTNYLPEKGVFGRDLSPRDYRRYLGQTLPSLAWDATDGLFPNAFAALAGALQDGANLKLFLPANYPAGDPDHLRLVDFGIRSDFRHFFNARLRHFANLFASAGVPEKTPFTVIKHRREPQIYVGKRGRGKTTALGKKILWLGEKITGKILIVAPFRSNLQSLWQMLPENENYLFLPPDDALSRRPAAEYLIVDEASAIPPAQLLALLQHYPAFTLAATEDGYEGTGREFSLRTLPQILAQHPTTEIIEQQTAKRFQAGDPLEWVLDNAFLLQVEEQETSFPVEMMEISREQLATNENLLRGVYALLRHAHYRTSPEDLKRLLDLPLQKLFIARAGNSIAGVLHILQEFPLPHDLAQAVIAGERRPQGRLLLQQLLQQTKDLGYNRDIYRISRIAVAKSQRRKGIAAALIATARQQLDYPLGVCYQHTEQLAQFWQSQGFREIYRSSGGKNPPTSLRISSEPWFWQSSAKNPWDFLEGKF